MGDEKKMDKANYYYNKDLKESARRLRNNSTKAEIKLWEDVLRAGMMHRYTFLRQKPVLNFIADFMCKEFWLIIEVDGYTHAFAEQWQLDENRQKELESVGFTPLRFSDKKVLNNVDNVEREIEDWVQNHPPAPPSKGDNTQPFKNRSPL